MVNIKKNIAVIGSGYWGKNLVRNFYEIGVLRWICDHNKDRLKCYNKGYQKIKVTTDTSELFADPLVEGVVIATPAETHFKLARRALESNKHVYVEKPLVLNEKDGEKLIQLAEKTNQILMVGHLLQYHPAFNKLLDLVRKNELGKVNYIYSNRLNLGKIRREENILWSFAPHDISMILSIANEMPESVMATGGNYLHPNIADLTTTYLEFPSGIRGHIFVSWLHPFKEQKLVVIGNKKMAVFNDTKSWNQKLLIYPHEIKWENNIPIPIRSDPENIILSQSEPLRLECEQFINCIYTKKSPKTDGNEGLKVLRILKASQKSLNQYGKKIKFAPTGHQDKKDEEKVLEKKKLFVHDTVEIDSGCRIGIGTKIWHFSHILKNCYVGKNCVIGQNVVIGPNVTIGNGCKIQNNVSVYQGVTLQDEVFCGPSMVFTNVYNPRAAISRMDQSKPTLVEKGATLGANCTILCGVTIGKYAFVSAGAVVLKNVPDHALVVGNPGILKGWMCQCGYRIIFTKGKGHCVECGRLFSKKGNKIEQII
jgi:predicted dehydrogenase/acetyltransferase-like isoleucine patch superfamily enzyme